MRYRTREDKLSKKSNRGRKTKFNNERMNTICEWIEDGCTIKSACLRIPVKESSDSGLYRPV